ncbi:MAG: hypothetical protein BWY66_02175 [bacterium ADurb.Bin374]|nr:MAG: hypothetical protein BWY66_02175 [bacterium ADurb.Bin374]
MSFNMSLRIFAVPVRHSDNRRFWHTAALAGAFVAGTSFMAPAFAQEAPGEPMQESQDVTTAIENGFYDALARGQASEAESILTGTMNDKTSTVLVNVPQLMLALANHLCESGELEAARPWYERLEKEYGAQIADEEGQKTFRDVIKGKLEWIRGGGKRPWSRPKAVDLAREIMAAIAASGTSQLETLLAATDIYVGWWQSELEPTAREDLIAFLAKHREARISWSNEAEIASLGEKADEQVVYANTHGWSEMEGGFRNVQFAIHRVPGGWEWRGIVLGEAGGEP